MSCFIIAGIAFIVCFYVASVAGGSIFWAFEGINYGYYWFFIGIAVFIALGIYMMRETSITVTNYRVITEQTFDGRIELPISAITHYESGMFERLEIGTPSKKIFLVGVEKVTDVYNCIAEQVIIRQKITETTTVPEKPEKQVLEVPAADSKENETVIKEKKEKATQETRSASNRYSYAKCPKCGGNVAFANGIEEAVCCWCNHRFKN